MKKFIALLVAVTMIMPQLTVLTSAAGESSSSDGVQFTQSDLHELVSYDEAVANDHISRVNEEEELNTIVFENKDGTRTMYYYSEDIKYADSEGVIRDKTNFLTHEADGYVNRDNDINVVMPDTLNSLVSEGISLTHNDFAISMQPNVMLTGSLGEDVLSGTVTADIQNVRGISDTITYEDVFGKGIDLKYTPTYSGIKEEIILNEYTGVSTFDFVVCTNGLYLSQNEDGVWGFSYDEEGELVAELSQVYIYDSTYKCVIGDIVVTEIENHESYGVTVVADEGFLAATDTVYPVIVDPTVTFSTYINGTKYIQDATISGRYPTTKYGTATTLSLSSNTSSYVAVCFPSFYSTNYYTLLKLGGIVTAKLCLQCSAKGTSAYVFAHKYSPTGSWDESAITYSSAGISCSSSIMDATASPSTGTVKLAISNNVKDWITTPAGAPGGILLKFNDSIYSSSGYYYTFYSTECSTSSYKPYLEINYNKTDILVHIKNLSNSQYLTYDPDKTNKFSFKSSVSDTTLSDVFRLVYDSSSNGYKIGSLKNTYGYDQTLDSTAEISSSGSYWNLVYSTSGYFRIVNQSTGKYLIQSGTGIAVSSSAATGANWTFESVDSYTVTINVTEASSGNALGITADVITKGNVESRQTFKITGGTKTIRVLNTSCGINVGKKIKTSKTDGYAIQHSEVITSACTLTFKMKKASEYPGFEFPIAKDKFDQISSSFGHRCYESTSGVATFDIHTGSDIVPTNKSEKTEVLSVSSGKVTYIEGSTSKGYCVVISYNSGEYFFVYDHLCSINVVNGQAVNAKDPIGQIGTKDGTSYSNHLHFGVYTKTNNVKTYYDSAAFLKYFR